MLLQDLQGNKIEKFFVFLGSLDNNKSVGTNTLIKEFAQIAISPEDIITNYPFLHKIKDFEEDLRIRQNLNENDILIKSSNLQKGIKENIDEEMYDIKEEYQEIYKIITKNPIDIDDIIKNTNMSLKEIISKLTMLELEGKIRKISGNRYIRCD